MTWLSPAAYGATRGVTKQAVLKAIKSGRLPTSCRRVDGKRWEINQQAADAEWDENTAGSKSASLIQPPRAAEQPEFFHPDSGEVAMTLMAAKRLKGEYDAKLAKLKYEQDSGLYVKVEDVKAEWFSIVTAVKTKLLAIPSKAKSNLPHLTPADIDMLDRLVREALEDISHELN